MTQVDQLFIIAGRHNQSVRLNHEVYPSVEAAKAELDRWEREEDPDHKMRERAKASSYQSKPFGRKDPHPRHNDGNFEVVDLATHIQNVAVQNYDKGQRDRNIYIGAHNTTQSQIDRLARLFPAS